MSMWSFMLVNEVIIVVMQYNEALKWCGSITFMMSFITRYFLNMLIGFSEMFVKHRSVFMVSLCPLYGALRCRQA